MTENQAFNRYVLDNGVFRKMVKPATSFEEVRGILKIINGNLPAKILATFGLWPEYVGLTRPVPRYPDGATEFSNILRIEEFNDAQEKVISSLLESYRSDSVLAPANLELKTKEFFEQRVSTKIGHAYGLAKDIIFFEGQDFNGKNFSWDALANQLSIDYAVDEMFHLVRHFPPKLFDTMGIFTRQMTRTLKEFKHLPMYRLAESVVAYIERVHTEEPDDTSPATKKAIRKALEGIKPLKPKEMGDCNYLWSSVQGVEGNAGLDPVTVISFDTQSRKRVGLLIDIFAAELGRASMLKTLTDEDLLRPGQIIVLCDKSCTVKDTIDVKGMVDAKLASAQDWEVAV